VSLRENFVDRHIGPDQKEIATMLSELGEPTLDSLIEKVVPENIAMRERLGDLIPRGISEVAVIARLKEFAAENKVTRSYIGTGYYGTITPPVVLRNILENPAWYTAYTPYQPEISQGRLEAIFAFQSIVGDLTGLPISNASMLDEATAAAEAMTLARRVWSGSDEAAFFVDSHLHPHIKAVIHTRAKPLKIAIIEGAQSTLDDMDQAIFGALLAHSSTYGEVFNLAPAIAAIKNVGAIAIVACDLLALTLYKSPGEYGADVAVGSAQRFGVPMGFGGPHAGFMAVRQGLERSLPGRLVGQSVDVHGNPAYRLALQTREQHIRRDKATSNICTAQVLLAVMSGFYAMWHGPDGLLSMATRVRKLTHELRSALAASGFKVGEKEIFDTFVVSQVDGADVLRRALEFGINLRKVSEESVGISLDETVTEKDLSDLLAVFNASRNENLSAIPKELVRHTKFLTHRVFNTYHSETAMLRYIRTLSDRDLALDRTMIPLGSCTMKLNATTEMIPVTWPEFSSLHPFAPATQSLGYRRLIQELSDWLIAITGYDAVSLQPNAGSQGEFAGLLAIRNFLDAHGESARDICLIPSSAHGTNAASAVMAGMKVVVVECDAAGNVSVDDLKAKIGEYSERLAALMVTYPSTHGVFEEAISEICGLVHDAGGQVYVDGANLNALVGLAQPGKFGADVSHLNLHKTFCIPHGGGGPGVGPVISRAHLAPFLPNHPLDLTVGSASGPGPVSSAPFGSASILPISWSYIQMMGGDGLTKATEVAILSANYIAKKLDPHFPVLYKGAHGYIAHECIVDLREITKKTGATVDDVAKRLMDYGFHAPTVSFPVAGTLMIEPTESEDIAEIDRFINAMISIRAEISDIEHGELTIEESPLRFAPHTDSDLLRSDWNRKYSREVAAYPLGSDPDMAHKGKYWPATGRIDGVFGDRNLVCSCTPISELAING
jgi:glycine dehydrogenase